MRGTSDGFRGPFEYGRPLVALPPAHDVREAAAGEHEAAVHSTADQRLVHERAVDVGRVEKRDAELERPVNRRDRLSLVDRP